LSIATTTITDIIMSFVLYNFSNSLFCSSVKEIITLFFFVTKTTTPTTSLKIYTKYILQCTILQHFYKKPTFCWYFVGFVGIVKSLGRVRINPYFLSIWHSALKGGVVVSPPFSVS